MKRSQLFDLMGELKLYDMKTAFDKIMATAVKRRHDPQRIIGAAEPRSGGSKFQEPPRTTRRAQSPLVHAEPSASTRS
jgi:hypothetical protein